MAPFGQRNVNNQPNQRAAGTPSKLRRHAGHPQVGAEKEPKSKLNRTNSQRMVPREERNGSPWHIPQASVPESPDPTRDSISDDIFFRAYYDPGLQKSVHDLQQIELNKALPRVPNLTRKKSASAGERTVRDGKVLYITRRSCALVANSSSKSSESRDLH